MTEDRQRTTPETAGVGAPCRVLELALLVDPEDPAALREAVLSVITQPEAARHRAEHAKARLAAAFGPGAWLDAHEALYRQVIARASNQTERR